MTKFFLNVFFKRLYNFFDILTLTLITTLIATTDIYLYALLYIFIAPISAVFENYTHNTYPEDRIE